MTADRNAGPVLPDFNRLVIAELHGSTHHSGVDWHRYGLAFLVRHRDSPLPNQWSERHFQEALARIDAEEVTVVAWLYADRLPRVATRVHPQSLSDQPVGEPSNSIADELRSLADETQSTMGALLRLAQNAEAARSHHGDTTIRSLETTAVRARASLEKLTSAFVDLSSHQLEEPDG